MANKKAPQNEGISPAVFPSVDSLAEDLGLSRQATYTGLRNNTIPHIRIGKRFIIPRAAIAEWLRTAGKSWDKPKD